MFLQGSVCLESLANRSTPHCGFAVLRGQHEPHLTIQENFKTKADRRAYGLCVEGTPSDFPEDIMEKHSAPLLEADPGCLKVCHEGTDYLGTFNCKR